MDGNLVRETVGMLAVNPLDRPHNEAAVIMDKDGEAEYELTRHATPEAGMTTLRARVSGALGERIRIMGELSAIYGEPIPTEQGRGYESIGVGKWLIEYAVPEDEADTIVTTETPS